MTLFVNILTTGFDAPNTRAIIFPVAVFQRHLRDLGIRVSIRTSLSDSLTDCDVLLVDSKFFRDWWVGRKEEALDVLASLSEKVSALHYFDTGDSSGWLKGEVLPHVTKYLKHQALRDRSEYSRPLYGMRLHTDYYHEKDGVEDSDPAVLEPVSDEGLLEKIGVAWNSSFANYTYTGFYRGELYARFGARFFLKFPGSAADPGSPRPNDVSCRIATGYDRETIAWQRKKVVELLKSLVPIERLSRRDYFRELSRSKVVISPFGYGEINYRDYETFLSGAALVKPDMSHMETWPNLFEDGETIASHNWDLSNLEAVIETLTRDDRKRIAMAAEGQRRYLKFLSKDEGGELFARRFKNLMLDNKQPAST